MKGFVLASNSPRRRQLLSDMGLKFAVIPSDADESRVKNSKPHMLVQELAFLKGADIAARLHGELVISADTIVVYDKKILGKPKDAEEAKLMLNMLSGNEHIVYTGICVTDSKTGKSCSDYEATKVKFYELSDDEIDDYIASGEPMDKAGAYGIQERGALFVEKIDGDFYNVVGLPLEKLNRLMKNEFDINL